MQDIVTLQQAKDHLRITSSDQDADVMRKVEEATVLVLDWVRQRIGDTDTRDAWYAVVDGWTDDTAPLQVQAAILRLTGHLFGDRGDGEPTRKRDQDDDQDLPRDVTMFLWRLRDRALA